MTISISAHNIKGFHCNDKCLPNSAKTRITNDECNKSAALAHLIIIVLINTHQKTKCSRSHSICSLSELFVEANTWEIMRNMSHRNNNNRDVWKGFAIKNERTSEQIEKYMEKRKTKKKTERIIEVFFRCLASYLKDHKK